MKRLNLKTFEYTALNMDREAAANANKERLHKSAVGVENLLTGNKLPLLQKRMQQKAAARARSAFATEQHETLGATRSNIDAPQDQSLSERLQRTSERREIQRRRQQRQAEEQKKEQVALKRRVREAANLLGDKVLEDVADLEGPRGEVQLNDVEKMAIEASELFHDELAEQAQGRVRGGSLGKRP